MAYPVNYRKGNKEKEGRIKCHNEVALCCCSMSNKQFCFVIHHILAAECKINSSTNTSNASNIRVGHICFLDFLHKQILSILVGELGGSLGEWVPTNYFVTHNLSLVELWRLSGNVFFTFLLVRLNKVAFRKSAC